MGEQLEVAGYLSNCRGGVLNMGRRTLARKNALSVHHLSL